MKINKYIGMAVCSWFMVACQNDEMEVIQPEQHTLIGQIVNSDANSRAQIELGCQAGVEYFFWNEKDRFCLYQHVNNELVESEFVISENYSEANGGAQQAEFTSTAALTPSVAYSAVYPSPATVTENKVKLEIQRSVDFSSAVTDAERAEVWKNYFNNNMFMAASGTFSESGRNYIQFKHLCSLARVSYVNQTGSEQQINGIKLSGQNLGIYMNYDLLNNRESGSGSTSGYRFSTTGLTVADKDTVDVYIFFFPKTIEKTDLEITIMQPTGNKSLSLPWKDILYANGNNESFRAGMRYWFDVTDTEKGLDWSKNMAEDGWVVFENKELAAALYNTLGSYKVLMTDEGFAKMTQIHVNSVNELDFSAYEGKISDLNGIENFRGLQTLKCNDLGLEMDMLDLSMFGSLSHVELAGNNLKELKLPAESWSMNYLDCHDNRISALDITGLKNMEYSGTLICGSQKDNIRLKLTMTENHKNKWVSEWVNNEWNTNVSYDGMSQEAELKLVAKDGGTFTLTESIRLSSPLIVEKDMTIDLGSEYYIGAVFNGFSDPNSLQTLIAVKPGATLTVKANGMNGQINTGDSEIQRSAIRLIKGDDGASGKKARLVINGGWIVARYYGILIDKDCPDSEVIINTNDRIQGDFRNEVNGTGILNLNNGKVVVENGTVVGNASAIEMRGGTLEVKNGTLVSEYTGETTNRSDDNANSVYGSAIAVSPLSGNSVSVTVNGGRFESKSSYSLYQIYMGGKPDNAAVDMSVTGGTFEKNILSENCNGFISGGRFKVQPRDMYLVRGKTAVLNGDYYEIKDSEGSSLVTIQNTELSKALYGVLGAEKVSFDADSCAMMKVEDVLAVKSLNFSNKGYTITSLAGIENFVNLEELRSNSVRLVSCDLSKNKALKVLMLTGNNFQSLDLSSNSNLEVLYLEGCGNLTSVKLDNCTKLGYVTLYYSHSLTSFDVPNKAALYSLNYGNTKLKLNLSEYTGLTTLKCNGVGLTELDLSTLTKIKTLWCHENEIGTLDITPLSNLADLRCGNQKNNIVLSLTESQITMWENTWGANTHNNNVTLKKVSGNPGNGNTGANDFTIGGIY